jgi:hypothetical protein
MPDCLLWPMGCFIGYVCPPLREGMVVTLLFGAQAEKGSPSNVVQGMKEVKDQVTPQLFLAPFCVWNLFSRLNPKWICSTLQVILK